VAKDFVIDLLAERVGLRAAVVTLNHAAHECGFGGQRRFSPSQLEAVLKQLAERQATVPAWSGVVESVRKRLPG